MTSVFDFEIEIFLSEN